MVDENDGTAAESRPPTLADLVALCRALNEENARYVIIGGMAIIHAGFVCATEDIDLMKKACGIDFQAAKDKIEKVSIEGVSIPFASPELLWELKQTKREKDEMDRMFLRELLKK